MVTSALTNSRRPTRAAVPAHHTTPATVTLLPFWAIFDRHPTPNPLAHLIAKR